MDSLCIDHGRAMKEVEAPTFPRAGNHRVRTEEVDEESFGMNTKPVLKKRRLNRCQSLSKSDWKQELDLVGELIEQHPNNYLVWDHRRCIVEKIGIEAVSNELEFTNKILLSKGTTNIQPWSHREWIIQKFDGNLWLSEIQYCHEILDKDIFNVTAWNQICRAVKLNPNMKKESRDIEVAYAKKSIYAQPGNEGPWSYLKFLYMNDKKSLYRDPNLECIYVNVLAEEADRIKFAVELDPPTQNKMNYASVDRRGCLNALSLIMDLVICGYKASLNRRLVEAVNVLIDNLRWTYSHVNPDHIKHGSDFLRKVYALVLSLDAFRIRYCYMYRAYYFSNEEKHPQNPDKEMVAMDRCDNLPLHPLKELFESWITSNGFVNLRSEWKERLFQTYLQNRKRYDRTEDDTLEDLKWIVRRLVVKNVGSNEAALDELQYTTNIIKDDAYNHRAWSHRQWVFQMFGKDWEDKDELDFCAEIIAKKPYNSFAWDQRYFLVTRWLPRIFYVMANTICDKVYEKKYAKLKKCFDERRAEELDFALKTIVANPENQLSWAHITGIHPPGSAGSFYFNARLVHSILRVLEEARDCARCLNLGDGSVMSLCSGSVSVNNARGIINALNMLLEIGTKHGCWIMKYSNIPDSSEEGKKFKSVLDELCSDSWISTLNYKFAPSYVGKIGAIIQAMEIALTDGGRVFRHATDELLSRDGRAGLKGICEKN